MAGVPDGGLGVEVRDVGVRVHRNQDVCHIRVDLVLHRHYVSQTFTN